jgi:hypothetical protein
MILGFEIPIPGIASPAFPYGEPAVKYEVRTVVDSFWDGALQKQALI